MSLTAARNSLSNKTAASSMWIGWHILIEVEKTHYVDLLIEEENALPNNSDNYIFMATSLIKSWNEININF
jgi:hypothetical protein